MKRSSIAIWARIAVTTLFMLSFVSKTYAQIPDVQLIEICANSGAIP